MKNQVKITQTMLMVNFEFPITVGQVSMNAIGQAHVYKDDESGEMTGDFEFIDHTDVVYMGMKVDGYEAWKKLKAHHLEFGINLDKLLSDEFDKVVDDKFQKEFLKKYDVKNF